MNYKKKVMQIINQDQTYSNFYNKLKAEGGKSKWAEFLADIVDDEGDTRVKTHNGKGLHVAVRLYNHLHNHKTWMVFDALEKGEYTYKLFYRLLQSLLSAPC